MFKRKTRKPPLMVPPYADVQNPNAHPAWIPTLTKTLVGIALVAVPLIAWLVWLLVSVTP